MSCSRAEPRASTSCSRAEPRARIAKSGLRRSGHGPLGALLVTVACALGACATSPGRLESNRFQHDAYPYSLFYGDGGRAEYPLGPHYTVENFYSPDGRHRHPRLGGEFSIDRFYREESPAVVGSESFYDLLLTRDQPRARFWLRSVPMVKADQGASLPSLAQRYLDTVAKTGRAAAPFGIEREAEPAPVQLRNVRTSACELSKRQALRVDFELQNPGAARTLDEPDWRSVSVIFIQTGYFARRQYPVVLLVGRESAQADDPVLTRDFDRMLGQLALGDVGQGLTMKGGTTCGSTEIAAAAVQSDAPPVDGSGGERTPELEVPIIQEDAPSP